MSDDMALPAVDDPHVLRVLLGEALEVIAGVFVLLTHDEDPPRVDLAANELQQAYQRIDAELRGVQA
jgi:hypothetical protein